MLMKNIPLILPLIFLGIIDASLISLSMQSFQNNSSNKVLSEILGYECLIRVQIIVEHVKKLYFLGERGRTKIWKAREGQSRGAGE